MSDFLGEIEKDSRESSKKSDPKLRESIIAAATNAYREKLEKTTVSPISEFGFSSEEQVVQDRIEEEFRTLINLSRSDSNEFLKLLKEKGVILINDSRYLEYLKNLRIQQRRFSPDMHEAAAVYVTKEDIQTFLERFRLKLPEEVVEELTQAVEGKNGVIFLGKNPTPLIKWHEGTHAVQHNDIYKELEDFERNVAGVKS